MHLLLGVRSWIILKISKQLYNTNITWTGMWSCLIRLLKLQLLAAAESLGPSLLLLDLAFHVVAGSHDIAVKCLPHLLFAFLTLLPALSFSDTSRRLAWHSTISHHARTQEKKVACSLIRLTRNSTAQPKNSLSCSRDRQLHYCAMHGSVTHIHAW